MHSVEVSRVSRQRLFCIRIRFFWPEDVDGLVGDDPADRTFHTGLMDAICKNAVTAASNCFNICSLRTFGLRTERAVESSVVS